MKLLARLLARLARALGPHPQSIKGHVNVEELFRALLTAIFAGGGVQGFLALLAPALPAIFPAPHDAALAGAVLTLILELRRRLNHGT